MVTTSHTSLPTYLGEDNLSQECLDLLSTLPREKGWIVGYLYQFQGSWYPPAILQGVLNCQKHFEAKDTDILIATVPKSGTTWLKALVFALAHRQKIQDSQENHPLLTNNPHALAPYWRVLIIKPKIHLTWLPQECFIHICHTFHYLSLSRTCPVRLFIVAGFQKTCLFHFGIFLTSLRLEKSGSYGIEDLFHQFCRGSSFCRPFWDHASKYWKLSQENREKVLFLVYEEMKKQPELQLMRLADFLGCPFTEEEEAKGSIDEIVKLRSFEKLSNLEANKKGTVLGGLDSSAFFRKGEIEAWKNTLTASMAEEVDGLTEEKLRGSGFKFPY